MDVVDSAASESSGAVVEEASLTAQERSLEEILRDELTEEALRELRAQEDWRREEEEAKPKTRMNRYKSVLLEIPPKSVTPPTVDRVRSHCMAPHCEHHATQRVIRLDGTFEYTCDACVPQKHVKVESIH